MPSYQANLRTACNTLDAVVAEELLYPRHVLGKMRSLHPDELLRYSPADLVERRDEARGALSGVYWSKHHEKIARAKASRYVPDKVKARALLDDYFAKSRHAKSLRDLGIEFVPLSEIVLANLESELAWQLYDSALVKNGGAKHVSECRTPPKPKRREVSADGYVKTGRYKSVDGKRVPIVRKVEP